MIRPRRRALSALCGGLLCAVVAGLAHAEPFDIHVDEARVMKLPEKVSTIVIGNPLIADATLQAGGILVITGKGYGSTNMLALDRRGQVVMDQTVRVTSPAGPDLVTVYRADERETLSCSPKCGARITLGDSGNYFTGTMQQANSRIGGAQASVPAGGPPPAR